MTELEQKAVDVVRADRRSFGSKVKVGDRIAVFRNPPGIVGFDAVALTEEMVRALCLHNSFRVDAAIGRILGTEGGTKEIPKEAEEWEEPAYFSADIRLKCLDCGTPFEWQGLPNGFSPYQPTVSIDGQELRIPAMPPGKTVPPGLPGFKVSFTSFEAEGKKERPQ